MRARSQPLQLIQIFRGAAACMVMLYHVTMVNNFYSPFLGNVFRAGHSGIDFFFVLSGFIMLYVHYDQAGRARQAWRFLALRAVRIFPIYWCVLAVTVVLFWMYPPNETYMWSPRNTLEPSTLIRAVFLYRQDVDAVVPVAWTLSFELAFYLFFSLYFVCGFFVFTILALAWCAAIGLQWSGTVLLGSYEVLLRPLIGEFFLGCLAAVLVKRFGRRISGWWVVLPIALWVATARAEFVGAIDPYTWYAAPFFLLILAGAAYDRATHRTYPRLLVLLGEASYALYLIHYGMVVLFANTVDYYRPTASVAPNVTLALLALTILGAGLLVHVCVERPLLARGRRWIGA